MSQELIYTSAPKGIKPGSRGFCTVAHSQGMAASLIDRLESLSGYRQVYSPTDPNAAFNPVAYAHVKITAGGRPLHVLSRVSAAGLDYTQRTNKFAHHVVLDPSELPPGGPAWLLASPKFMQATWQGEPRMLPAGRPVPSADVGPGICHAWKQATGDAGWGGVLAETAINGSRKQVTIIFRPGMDMLRLIGEALALLPTAQRWAVSFCTYFTKMPPGVECQWRCCVEGSPEAAAVKKMPNQFVIDLSSPQGAPDEGRFVDAARNGIALAAVPVTPNVTAPINRPAAPMYSAVRDAGANRPMGREDAYEVAGPPVSIEAAPLRPGRRQRPFSKKRPPKWPRYLAIATGFLLLGGVVTLAVIWGSTSGWFSLAQQTHYENDTAAHVQPKAAAESKESRAKKEAEERKKQEDENRRREAEAKDAANLKAQQDADLEQKRIEQASKAAAATLDAGRLASEAQAEKLRKEAVDTAWNSLEEEEAVNLPPCSATAVSGSNDELRINSKDWTALRDCTLDLVMNQGRLGPTIRKCELRCEPDLHPGAGERRWGCYFLKSKLGAEQAEPFLVAVFAVDSRGITFQWNSKPQAIEIQELYALRNCILRISATEFDKPKLVALRKRRRVPLNVTTKADKNLTEVSTPLPREFDWPPDGPPSFPLTAIWSLNFPDDTYRVTALSSGSLGKRWAIDDFIAIETSIQKDKNRVVVSFFPTAETSNRYNGKGSRSKLFAESKALTSSTFEELRSRVRDESSAKGKRIHALDEDRKKPGLPKGRYDEIQAETKALEDEKNALDKNERLLIDTLEGKEQIRFCVSTTFKGSAAQEGPVKMDEFRIKLLETDPPPDE